MIVKVADGRRDGKTSFEKLGGYLTAGILQSGEPPTKTSWDALTQYITAESVLNSLGDEVEKTIAVEIGNVFSLKTAPLEMQATARHNPRQKDPVYHYILSWPESERPATQDIFKAARHSLAALGLSEHQYIIAIHANTDNIHAHIEVNRIHPKTFKATTLNWAHETLHKAAREAEIEFGWSHDNGIYEVIEVNGEKHIVKASERQKAERQAKGAANRFEIWNGEESLESWCRGEPAAALKAALADSKTASWQDIHRALVRHGLELRDSGGNGMKVFDISEASPEKAGQELAVSASKAFRFLKRADLEARFGKFMARAEEVSVPSNATTYKRDPKKRLERKLERKALRDALRACFKSHVAELKQDQALAKRVIAETFDTPDAIRYAILMNGYRTTRAALKVDPTVSAAEKKQMHMINRLSMQKMREALRLQLQQERRDRRALIPSIPTWREWVEQQAQLGDDAAISALRGMIYQEGRDAKKAGQQASLPNDDEAANTIRPAVRQDTDPYVRSLQNLIWKVAKNGRVTYAFKDGQAGFADDGDRLTFGRKEVSDEALMASLRYAADKWGYELHLAGGDAVFKERVLHMAVAHNIVIKNPELQQLQTQLRASFDCAHADPAYQDILSLVTTRNAHAQVRRPDGKTKSFAGQIVGENSIYLVQHIGANDYIVHAKSAFKANEIDRGKPVTVKYQDTTATITSRADRPKGDR